MNIEITANDHTAQDLLKSAVKWLERIESRKDELPKSFLDGCDSGPLAKQIREYLSTRAIPKPTCPLYAVKDHEGDIVHTTISTEPQDCINDWLETEACFRKLANVARGMKGFPPLHEQLWETYLAQGYSVVPVEIVEAQE